MKRRSPQSRTRRRSAVALAAGAVVVPLIAIGTSCDDEQAPGTTSASSGNGGSASASTTGATTSSSSSSSSSSEAGGGGSGGQGPEPPVYDPDAADWVPVAWESPCKVDMALQPELGAPPLFWVPCGSDAPGCDQQHEQPLLDTGSQKSKVSVVPWNGGYRIGITESFKQDGQISAVYDGDGTAMVAWRVESLPPNVCISNRPIVSSERVWFGVTAIDPDLTSASVVIAPTWNELTTVSTTYTFNHFYQAWFASSEVMLGWVADGKSLHVRDLATGKQALFGNGFLGNPDYAYPHVVGSSAVALTAPDGYPDVTVWDRSTEAFIDLVDPTPPLRVADANSDGETLVWIVKPDPDAPGELWTSPMTVTPQGLDPTYRRTTPTIKGTGSAAGDGHYAVYSFSDVLQPGGGPGDGKVHVYRLSDAHHWAFPVPASSVEAVWIYHVDADYVFYSGYGSVLRQRLDVVGPGDPAP